MKSALLSTLFLVLVGIVVQAAEVTTVKGTKALLTLSGMEDAQVGQQVFSLSADGKKVGLLELKKIQAGKALAEVIKGHVEVGQKIAPRSGAAGNQDNHASESQNEETSPTRSKSKKKYSVGFLGGYGMHSFAMDVGPTTTTARDSAKMTGTSFSLKAFGDYDLGKNLNIRAASGLETFAAKTSIPDSYCSGGTATGTSSDCSVSFTYLALEGAGQFNWSAGKSRYYSGLGYSFLLQMSGSNTIPNLQTSGGSNQMLLFQLFGADIGLGRGRFIPVVLEYGYFPGGADVKASSLFIRGGYGFPF